MDNLPQLPEEEKSPLSKRLKSWIGIKNSGANEEASLRQRTEQAAWTFTALNGLGLVASGGIELASPNVMSLSQAAMSGYDWVLSGGMYFTDKLDEKGHEKSARATRAALSMGHIAVAAYGAMIAYNRTQSGEIGTPQSLIASAAVAGISIGALFLERYRSRNTELAEVPKSRLNGHNLVHRLLGTKAIEAFTGFAGAFLQAITNNPHYSFAATAITTGAVGILMGRQVKDELSPGHVKRIGEIPPSSE